MRIGSDRVEVFSGQPGVCRRPTTDRGSQVVARARLPPAPCGALAVGGDSSSILDGRQSRSSQMLPPGFRSHIGHCCATSAR